MADREFIEFVLTATDLASRKLNQAATNIEAETRKIENAAKGASGEIDRLGDSLDKAGTRGSTLRGNMRSTAVDMEQARLEADRYEQRVRTLPGAIERFTTALAGNVRALRQHHTAARTLGGDLNGVDRAAAQALRGVDALAGGATRLARGFDDVVARSRRMRGELDLVRRAEDAARTGFRLLEDGARGVGRAILEMGDGVGKTTKELEQNARQSGTTVSAWQRIGSVWGRASSAALGLIGSLAGFARIGVILVAIPFAIQGIAGAAEVAGGAIFALASALSTLSATAVGIPAVLTAVAGSIAAITLILKPAVSGILQYVAAAGKAQTATSGGAGSGTAGAVLGLEKQLHNLRVQNALQEKQAEQQLATLKLNVAQQLIQDQKQLNLLKKSDRIDEKTAQSDLTAAKQRLRVLEAEHAPAVEIKAAKAEVAQDEENLHKVVIANKSKEGQAEAKLQSDKRNGQAQIKQAEEQIHQLKIQNAQQELALQKQITQAQTGSTSAVAKQAQLYKNLSPLQRQVANEILNLKKRWDQLTQSFKDRFLHEVLTDLQDVNRFLPVIAKTVGAFANTITDTIASIRTKLVTPSGAPSALGQRVGGFVDFIHTQQRIALGLGTSGQAAGGGLLDLATAITRFVTSKPAQEFIHFMAEGVNQLGKWALNAEKAGEKTGGIAKFFERATTVAKLVGDIIKNLGAAVLNVGHIAFPTGKGFLDSLDQISRRFRRFTESARGRNEIVKFFNDVRDAAHHADKFIETVLSAVGKLGRTAISRGTSGPTATRQPGGRVVGNAGGPAAAAPSGLSQFFDLLTSATPVAATFIDNFTKTTGPALIAFLKAAGPILVVVAQDTATLLGVLTQVALEIDRHPWARDLTAALIGLFLVGPKVVKGIKTIKGAFNDARTAAKLLKGAWTKVFADDAGAAGGLSLINKVKLAVSNTLDRIKALSTGGISRLKELGQRGFQAVVEHAKTMRGKLIEAANVAKDLGKRGFTAAINSAKDLGSKMATAATNMGTFLKSVGASGLTALKSFAIMVGTTIVGALQSMAVALGIATVGEEGFTIALSATGIGAIIVVIGLLIAAIILIATHWDQTKKIVVKAVGIVKDAVVGAFHFLVHAIPEAMHAIVGFIEKHWKDIILFLAGPLGIALLLSQFVGGPGAIWDKLKSLTSEAWGWVLTHIKGVWHDLVGFFTNTAPGAIKGAITSLWGEIKHLFGEGGYHVFEIVRTLVNGVVSAVNWVSHLLHLGDLLHPIPDVTEGQFETATAKLFADGGIYQPVPGGVYRFVEAGHPEAIVPLDPAKRDRAFQILDQIGSHMRIPGFAGGGIAGDPKRGGLPTNDPVTGAIGGALGSIGTFVSDLKDRLPDFSHVGGKIGRLVLGAGNKLKDKVVSWAEGKFNSLVSSFLPRFGETPTITPQTLRGLELEHKIDRGFRYLGRDWGSAPISAALHRYPGGIPPWNQLLLADGPLQNVLALALGLYNRTKQSDLVKLIGRTLQESGGETGIINQWDSNWTAGHPSIGLLQTIGPTFVAHARQPFTNIWDPLHNAVAAIGYMLSSYHRIVGPSGSGYALGGLVGDHKAGVTAGGLRDGEPVRILAHVGEWILNREQQDKLAGLFGGRDRAFHALFNRPSFSGMFAQGGVVTGGLVGAAAAGGGAQVQVGPIYTTSPKVDIEYVSRALEMRLGRF